MEGPIVFLLRLLSAVLHGHGISTREKGSDTTWLHRRRSNRGDYTSMVRGGRANTRSVDKDRNYAGQLRHDNKSSRFNSGYVLFDALRFNIIEGH